MDPLSIASAGIGIGSSIMGMKLGFDQANMIQKETQEQIRRFFRTTSRTYSMAEAEGGGASGITDDSKSLTKYLADMSSEFNKQADWMRQVGGNKAYAQEVSTLFNGLSSFGSSMFSFGRASPTIK